MAVFRALFDVPTDFKKAQIVMTPEEFEEKASKQEIQTSVRYSKLYVTGKKVKITWKKGDNTFTVGGTYGLRVWTDAEEDDC